MNNTAYWIAHPLTEREMHVLLNIHEGLHRKQSKLFEEAGLVERECITADEQGTLCLTDKGIDAINHFFGGP